MRMAQTGNGFVWEIMKTTQALNFFLVGLGMCFSPAFWPDYFSGNANGDNTSELWVLSMGMTQMAMGAWLMGLNEVPRLMHAMAEWEPVTLNFELPDVGWALPESFYAGLQDDDDVSTALSLQQQLRMRAA